MNSQDTKESASTYGWDFAAIYHDMQAGLYNPSDVKKYWVQIPTY